jgi:hypothetical protein
LSSSTILDPLLNQWFVKGEYESGVGTLLDSRRRKAEQLHRFMNGLPAASRLVRFPRIYHTPSEYNYKAQLVGEVIAWSAESGVLNPCVLLFNIKTGHTCRITLPGGHFLHGFALTTTHLVCSTKSK